METMLHGITILDEKTPITMAMETMDMTNITKHMKNMLDYFGICLTLEYMKNIEICIGDNKIKVYN